MPTPSEFAALVDQVKANRHDLANHAQSTNVAMSEVRKRLDRTEADLLANTEATKRTEATALRTEAGTQEIIQLFKDAKGFIKVSSMLTGTVAKVGACASVLTGAYLGAKHYLVGWLIK